MSTTEAHELDVARRAARRGVESVAREQARKLSHAREDFLREEACALKIARAMIDAGWSTRRAAMVCGIDRRKLK